MQSRTSIEGNIDHNNNIMFTHIILSVDEEYIFNIEINNTRIRLQHSTSIRLF